MGALANYIERAGVATVSISLIREQSEAVRPPRALWVPFALGRPLGSAASAEFQKNVMRPPTAGTWRLRRPELSRPAAG